MRWKRAQRNSRFYEKLAQYYEALLKIKIVFDCGTLLYIANPNGENIINTPTINTSKIV